jgi:hypothetical protein
MPSAQSTFMAYHPDLVEVAVTNIPSASVVVAASYDSLWNEVFDAAAGCETNCADAAHS